MNTKNEIIKAIIKAIKNDVTKLTRDNIIRGNKKVITESQMFEFWPTFGSMKQEIISLIDKAMNNIGCDEDSDESEEHVETDIAENNETETQNNTADNTESEVCCGANPSFKTINIQSIECRSGAVTVPSHFNIYDIMMSVNVDITNGNYSVRVDDNIIDRNSYTSFIPNDNATLRVQKDIKGNR